MASIFLSYARPDATRAKRMANALEQAGHSVWWDKQLNAGSRFAAEIDRELKSADMVIVLWSTAAVESAWVHDEAAAGRDSGRLVPVLISKVEPPLGFRQYQAIDLSSRRLGSASLKPLLDPIEQRSLDKHSLTREARKPATRPTNTFGWLAAITAALLCIGVGVWWYASREPSYPSIAIDAAGSAPTPLAKFFAEGLTDELRRYQAGPLSVLEVRSPGSRSRPMYRATVSVLDNQGQRTLGLSIDLAGAGQLWSTTLEAPATRQSDLLRGAGTRMSAAIACDLGQAHAPLITEVRRLYVDGCSRMAEAAEETNEQAIDLFRQVTQKAPRFAPGWAHLSLAEFRQIWLYSAPEADASKIAHSAGEHSVVATKLDPKLAEPYYVRAFDGVLDRPGYMPRALSVLEVGLRHSPESTLLQNGRAEVLAHFGRLQEALDSAKSATILDPLSASFLRDYVMLLAYAGQNAVARQALDRASAAWPQSKAVTDVRFEYDLRSGDPGEALSLIRNGQVDSPGPGVELFLQARQQPTPENIRKVLGFYRALLAKDPSNLFGYLLAFGTFGSVDETYRMLIAPDIVDRLFHNGEALFRPNMKRMRADPRFMDVANRAGLLPFWRKTNIWPDFCSDPQLPYDCRKEAQKYL